MTDWDLNLDVVIDAADESQSERRVVRRTLVQQAIDRSNLVLLSSGSKHGDGVFDGLRCECWLEDVFGEIGITDVEERVLRFVEETLELAQAEGITREQALLLVQQVFDKPVGDADQELGGVMVTLGSYLAVAEKDGQKAFETEFARVDTPEMKAKIRTKHAGKLVMSSKFRP